MTETQERIPDRVFGGVDTHKDLHVAAVVDGQDRILATQCFATTRQGYRQMLSWMRSFGELQRLGIESTGSYGAGLLRFMQAAGVDVREVTAPDRHDRRRRGKNDDLDAQNAAHAAFRGQRTVTPKSRDGMIEALRVLKACRKTAVAARRVALQMIHNTVVAAPDELREILRKLTRMQLVRTLAAWRPDLSDYRSLVSAYRISLKSLARRYLELHDEIADLDTMIGAIVETLAPALLFYLGRPGRPARRRGDDPISGQPELKGTPVRLTPLATFWRGSLLRRTEAPMAEGPYYWARIPLDNGQAFELAGWEPLPGAQDADAWILGLLCAPPTAELITYADPGRGAFRYARIIDDRLDACLLLARRATELPASETLVAALGTEISPDARLGLLARRTDSHAATNDARIICVCFGVGLRTLRHEIVERRLTNLSEIGVALRAGTNCGSCIPELNGILRGVQHETAPAT